MDNFLNTVAELLEEDSVNPQDEFNSFDAWDSLATLSIIALADEEYGVTISTQEINEAETIEGLFKLIKTKQG